MTDIDTVVRLVTHVGVVPGACRRYLQILQAAHRSPASTGEVSDSF